MNGQQTDLYLIRREEEYKKLQTQLARLRSVLNEFDNPYQVGDVWQWTGPAPEDIDAAMKGE